MFTQIDWLSFTVKFDISPDGETEISVYKKVQEALYELLGENSRVLSDGQEWSWSGGRTPYKLSSQRADNGAIIFLHPSLPHALVEITGRGCDALADNPRAGAFLQAIIPRLTRLDVACDMLTDTRPLEFVEKRDKGRFKAHSEFTSESGDTCYVGSRTSNRYARVYRYNYPHERHHLLRCEFVVKAEDAKTTAQAILDRGLPSVASSLGRAFSWQHDDWQPEEVDAEVLKVWRPERKEGKTLYWLADTVAPLVRRLHNERVIAADDWTQIHIFTPLGLVVRIVRKEDADV
jgi:hypothetical protein